MEIIGEIVASVFVFVLSIVLLLVFWVWQGIMLSSAIE